MTDQASNNSTPNLAEISLAAAAAEAKRLKFRKNGFTAGIIAAASVVVLPVTLVLTFFVSRTVPALATLLGLFFSFYLFAIIPLIILGAVFMSKAVSARGERDRLVAASSQSEVE
jgi:hypothetical protein